MPVLPNQHSYDYARNLTSTGYPPLHGHRHEQELQICLCTYWQRIRLVPLVDPLNETGVTWLELFAWFTLRGGRVHPAQQASDFIIKPTFSKMMKLFISGIKQLLKLADDQGASLVRAAPSRTRPLTSEVWY